MAFATACGLRQRGGLQPEQGERVTREFREGNRMKMHLPEDDVFDWQVFSVNSALGDTDGWHARWRTTKPLVAKLFQVAGICIRRR